MGKAVIGCLLGAAVILIVFLYFLGGMWLNVFRKRMGLDKDAPIAWIKLVIWIEGGLELFGVGLFTGLYLKLTMGAEAAVQRSSLTSNWIFKGIILGVMVITLILHIVFNIHSLGKSTAYLFLHLVVDPIALITPKDEVKELDTQYTDAIANQQMNYTPGQR